ncbi:General transcription factor 3C polypeptide 5 [Paramecium bursaria]
MNNSFQHITLPFHFSGDPKQAVDLNQVHEFDKRQQDIQVIQTNRGSIVVKREQENNYLFKVRKFQHKEKDYCVYKLELVCTLDKTYDPQTYFQDFYYPQRDDKEIIDQLKQNILSNAVSQDRQLALPPYLIKPFSWRGSNLKIENLGRKIKKTKLLKKPHQSIKFDQQIPQKPEEKNPNEKYKKIFQQRPIWLKSALHNLLRKLDLEIKDDIIKQYAYYYLDGPWSRCYVSYDYDPMNDRQAAQYQTIMIINIQEWEENATKPLKNQSIYQLCDIKSKDREIQKLINQACDGAGNIDKKFGWFERKNLKQIIRIIKKLKL